MSSTYDQFTKQVAERQSFSFDDGTDTWQFVAERRELPTSRGDLITLARGPDSRWLCQPANAAVESAPLFLVDTDHVGFHALSLRELFHRRELLRLSDEEASWSLRERKDSIARFASCPGCGYWLANGVVYRRIVEDETLDEHAVAHAVDVLIEAARVFDPRACSLLASYFVMVKDDRDAEYEYLKKATVLGSYLEVIKLIETIVEGRNEEIATALELLQPLRAHERRGGWAFWMEANIHLKGQGVKVDTAKGLVLLERAVSLEHAPAMADYAYFQHEGIGMRADKAAALKLLKRADDLGGGAYAHILRTLETGARKP